MKFGFKLGAMTPAPYRPEYCWPWARCRHRRADAAKAVGHGAAATDLLDLADLPVVATDVVGEVLVGGPLAEVLVASQGRCPGFGRGRFCRPLLQRRVVVAGQGVTGEVPAGLYALKR